MATHTIKRGEAVRFTIAEYNGWQSVRLNFSTGLPAGLSVAIVPSGIYFKVYVIGTSIAPAGSYPILVSVTRIGTIDVSPRTITPTIKLVDPTPSQPSNTGGSGSGSGSGSGTGSGSGSGTGSGTGSGNADGDPPPGTDSGAGGGGSSTEDLLTWFQAEAEAMAGARIRLVTDNDRWYECVAAVWYIQLHSPTTKILTTRRVVQAADWSVERFRATEWTLAGIPGQPASAGSVWRTIDSNLSYP